MAWCTIESDPGVFTSLIESIGVKGVQVEEMYSMDSEFFEQVKPVHGLIFLFKWTAETQRPAAAMDASDAPHVYFARQVINNACATQAMISILMNAKGVDIGPHLTEFKAETHDFDPEMKGLALSNSELIRTSHNSFARPEPIELERTKDEDDDAFHFSAYLPIDGHLYELDGLQKGPTHLGKIENERWWEMVAPLLQERIARYAASEIRFNLLAIVRNKRDAYLERGASLVAQRALLEERIVAAGGSASSIPANPLADQTVPPATLTDEEKAVSALPLDDAVSRAGVVCAQLSELRSLIAQEEYKFANWKKENERRRHNFIPAIMTLICELSKKGELEQLTAKATRKAQARAVASQERKKAKMEQ
eukprot:CAMPEP_0114554856 /NCGR_PEP_ID=MMETSP0114-20121206/8434_1 /TAXON_ID=31324 /ORGANISM="Goniomonas sp, Strain m" /LENGTH=365 /DNA_ID=CAMNT_0001739933 /DNA_START=9 /DNA_END=1106 /DNA_ORIENTATION=+